MTIVIPYKWNFSQDCEANSVELKFALRSIEKNLTGWKSLVIIGQPPEWFRGLNYISIDDVPGRKEYSVYRKLLSACNAEYISENFIYWNDDHFLLKPLNVSEIKYWHNGPLAGRHVYNRERIKIVNTLERFKKQYAFHCKDLSNYHEPIRIADENNYDIHTPIIFNKKIFKEMFNDLTEEICIKSYYCFNAVVDGEFMEDCKIVGHFSKEEVKQKIAGRLFFSTNAICDPTIEVLEEMFPDKSKFES